MYENRYQIEQYARDRLEDPYGIVNDHGLSFSTREKIDYECRSRIEIFQSPDIEAYYISKDIYNELESEDDDVSYCYSFDIPDWLGNLIYYLMPLWIIGSFIVAALVEFGIWRPGQ